MAAGDNSQLSDLPPLLEAKPLPYSLAAVRQAFRADVRQDWRSRWQLSPRYARMSKIDDNLPSQSYLSDTAGLTRAQRSLVTQLRTGHALLNQHLYRIKQAPSPLCPTHSRANESTHHYLLNAKHMSMQDISYEQNWGSDEHGCSSQHVSNSNSTSVKHLSLLPSPTASSQPTLPYSIHHLSSIIRHQWQLPISSLLNPPCLNFPDIQ